MLNAVIVEDRVITFEILLQLYYKLFYIYIYILIIDLQEKNSVFTTRKDPLVHARGFFQARKKLFPIVLVLRFLVVKYPEML